MNNSISSVASPEKLGFSSEWVEKFLDEIDENNICLHSFLMMRHGKIAAEGYYHPFKKDTMHRMYSVTKSFVSLAIGVLIDEGKISLNDKVADFFRDRFDMSNIQPYTAEATVRDLLRMATPFCEPAYTIADKDWLNAFFRKETDHPAGTIFNYDSSGSYVLGAIVRKITGMSFLDYLQKKVLGKIGFSENARCLTGPDGEEWAGSGLMCTTRDLAKCALLLQKKGNWDGEQLISKEFVASATSRQIDNNSGGSNYAWNCGYGYQFWILKDKAFCFNGMGGQLAICVPEKEFIFVCTADIQGNNCGKEIIYSALWRNIVDRLAAPLPQNISANQQLTKRCNSLAFKPITGEKHSDFADKINKKTYILNDNPMGISKISVEISGDEGILSYTNPRGDKKLYFGLGKYIECGFPETHYPGEKLGERCGRMYKSINCGAWVEEKKLVIRTYIIDDYIGNLTITLSYKNNEIGVSMRKNAQFFLDEYQGFAGGVEI